MDDLLSHRYYNQSIDWLCTCMLGLGTIKAKICSIWRGKSLTLFWSSQGNCTVLVFFKGLLRTEHKALSPASVAMYWIWAITLPVGIRYMITKRTVFYWLSRCALCRFELCNVWCVELHLDGSRYILSESVLRRQIFGSQTASCRVLNREVVCWGIQYQIFK